MGDFIQRASPATVKKAGEMYIYSNTVESVIDTADVWHALYAANITAGVNLGWTFADGVRGTDITAYATYDGGASTLVTTTAAHNLSAGDYISITGTTNYNDLYEVLSAPSSTTFEIDKAWDTNDDATGTYARGATLTAGANASGHYPSNWSATLTPGTTGHIFTMGFMINKTPCDKCRARQKLGTATQYECLPGTSIFDINEGDKVSFIIKNVGATGNYTLRHGNVNFHKMGGL